MFVSHACQTACSIFCPLPFLIYSPGGSVSWIEIQFSVWNHSIFFCYNVPLPEWENVHTCSQGPGNIIQHITIQPDCKRKHKKEGQKLREKQIMWDEWQSSQMDDQIFLHKLIQYHTNNKVRFTLILMKFLKELFTQKFQFRWKCTNPQAIQDADEFVSSSK